LKGCWTVVWKVAMRVDPLELELAVMMGRQLVALRVVWMAIEWVLRKVC